MALEDPEKRLAEALSEVAPVAQDATAIDPSGESSGLGDFLSFLGDALNFRDEATFQGGPGLGLQLAADASLPIGGFVRKGAQLRNFAPAADEVADALQLFRRSPFDELAAGQEVLEQLPRQVPDDVLSRSRIAGALNALESPKGSGFLKRFQEAGVAPEEAIRRLDEEVIEALIESTR